MEAYKLSVIVPIYNVAPFIERCVESLMRQTLDGIEYIFVDDCSPDNSYDILMDVLSRYPQRQDDVRIIRHAVNRGLAQSRADGLDLARGEFITHCDSDDWVDETMYQKLYEKAKQDGSEIAICGFKLVTPECEIPYLIDLDTAGTHEQMVRSYIRMIWNTVWDMIVHRDVYQRSGARPPVGIHFHEDFYLDIRLVASARKVSIVNESLYYYNQLNSGSIVHKRKDIFLVDEMNCYDQTIQWMKETDIYPAYEREMHWRMLKAKSNYTFTNKFKEFRTQFPESNKYAFTLPLTLVPRKAKLMMILTYLHLDPICRWNNRRHGR